MENKFNLVKNIRFAIISFIINIFLVFISYKLVIHFEGLEALGLWSLLIAWANLIRIGDVGMGNATLHFISKTDINKNSNDIDKFIDTGFLMNFIAFLILTSIGYLIVNMNLDLIVDGTSIEKAKILLPIIFIAIFFSTLSSIIFGSLNGLHIGYLTSYIIVAGNIIQIILVLILVPKIGIIGLVWAQLIQYIFQTLFGWYLVKKNTNSKTILPVNISLTTLKCMLNFSLKAQIANITNGLFEPISKIIFSNYGNLQMQGIYEIAYKTVLLSKNTVLSGLAASLPSFTNLINNDDKSVLELYKKSHKNVLKGSIVIFTLVIIGSPLVSIIWVGQFEINYWLFVILLSLGFFFNAFGATAYNLGLATGKMKNNIITTVSIVLLLTIFANILGFFYGPIGMVSGVSLSLVLGGMLIKYLNEKLLYRIISENTKIN